MEQVQSFLYINKYVTLILGVAHYIFEGGTAALAWRAGNEWTRYDGNQMLNCEITLIRYNLERFCKN